MVRDRDIRAVVLGSWPVRGCSRNRAMCPPAVRARHRLAILRRLGRRGALDLEQADHHQSSTPAPLPVARLPEGIVVSELGAGTGLGSVRCA